MIYFDMIVSASAYYILFLSYLVVAFWKSVLSNEGQKGSGCGGQRLWR